MSAERRRSTGPVVPHRPTAGQRWIAQAVRGVILALGSTLRFRVRDPEGVLEASRLEPAVFALWHNRLALSMQVHTRFVQQGPAADRRLAALVSASRDGALLSAILESFGVEPVRGSSSRRGPQALLELKTWAAKGVNLAITPDGPRGPCYAVQPGIIAVAAVTGRAIIPLVWNSPWKLRLRSWDRFQVPLPFGRWELRTGPPLRIPEDAGGEALEAARQELQRRLLAITED